MSHDFFTVLPRSAYLHIPFCHRRCFYCDFAVVPLGDQANGETGVGSGSIKTYLDLLNREIKNAPKGPPLSTIYIGGGTPSLLTPKQISRLLESLRNHFGFQYGCELTLEIDPASFDKRDLYGYIEAGVNRFSLGGQSFNDETLKKIGRRHRSNQLIEACGLLNELYQTGNISSWNLDLMQSLPGQDFLDWQEQLSLAINTFAPHLSIYDLSIEPGTVFAKLQKKGMLSLPNNDLSWQMMRLTSSKLCKAGYGRYEISNFAFPGHASRHNRVYWSSAGWWGFGLGATSCPWGERFARPRIRDAYREWIENQENQGIHSSLLYAQSSSMDLFDVFVVGLRRREGVDLCQIAKSLGWSQKQFEIIFNSMKLHLTELTNKGYLIFRGKRLSLSDPSGMEISNQILVEILLWLESFPAALSSFPVPSQKVCDHQSMAG